MREITTHKTNGLNKLIKIEVTDEPGAGGASHVYDITYDIGDNYIQWTTIKFQKGSLQENGINGISNEALLAIVIDRLECFQAGPFACRENHIALSGLTIAMHALKDRTKGRLERGVEGKFIL